MVEFGGRSTMCLREKTSQIAKVQKKLRISVAISQFFVIEQGGLCKRNCALVFSELVTNDYPVGDLCARCGDAQEIDA